MVVRGSAVDPRGHMADWELWQRIVPNTSSLRKDADSKFQVWFQLNVYHFWTIIKSKVPKSNQHK